QHGVDAGADSAGGGDWISDRGHRPHFRSVGLGRTFTADCRSRDWSCAYVGWSMVSSLFLTPLALCTMDSADWGTRTIEQTLEQTPKQTPEQQEVPVG